MKTGGQMLFPKGTRLAERLRARMEADLPVGNEWLWPSATSRSGHIEEPKENGLPSPHEYRHHARTLFIASGVPYEERSEEHTSELQSLMRLAYGVVCLKKNTIR